MLKKKPEAVYFPVLFFLVALTYQESLGNYFLADDALWLMQAKKAEQSVLAFFQPVGGFFRPMVTFTYLIIYKFFNLNPAPYYFFCAGLHFVNCVVLYYFCLEFFRTVQGKEEKSIAFLSAVLFAVLYAHCEAVIWVGALGDSFLLLFCLLSFIFFLKLLGGGTLSFYLFLSLIFDLLALFSKESALAFPVLLLIFCAAFKKEKRRQVMPCMLLTLAYVVFYKMIMPTTYLFNAENLYYVVPALLKAFQIIIVSFLGFGRNLIWIFDEINVQLFSTKLVFQCMALGGLVLYGYVYLKKKTYRFRNGPDTKKILLFFVCFIAIAYLPVAVYIKPEKSASDVSQTSLRYFYLPDAGFCILAAFVLHKFFQQYRHFILQNMFILSLIVVNVIPVYQTEWSYNFFGRTRKQIIERVVSLHERHKNHPYILLVNYPGQVGVHLHTYTLAPLFQLYGKNVHFVIRKALAGKVRLLPLDQVCFFEWADVTFVDKTPEYVRVLKEQRQKKDLKITPKL